MTPIIGRLQARPHHLHLHLLPPPPKATTTQPHNSLQVGNPSSPLPLVISWALAVALASPLPASAIPSLSSQRSPPTTPFSQSKNLLVGLQDGKIRPCPSTNPGCVSTNPRSSSFAFPLTIPNNSTANAIQELKKTILKTQRNAQIQVTENTPNGQYLRAEVDGRFGRDVLEFLIKGDVVAYRSMATKVTYLYPFATAIGDSKGQEERVKRIVDELGWYSPNFDSMND